MDQRQLRDADVPLLPLMGSLTMLYSWFLEVGLVAGHHFSGGAWPATLKYWVVGAVAAISTAYKLTWNRQYTKDQIKLLSRSPLKTRQVFVMACFLIAWSVLGGWLMCGPPGPPFAPA
jgi:hypothetical protein